MDIRSGVDDPLHDDGRLAVVSPAGGVERGQMGDPALFCAALAQRSVDACFLPLARDRMGSDGHHCDRNADCGDHRGRMAGVAPGRGAALAVCDLGRLRVGVERGDLATQ